MIVYKTTNLINGKVYIGKDKYNDPKYLGSGILLKKSIKKYGIENFKKEILFESENETEINEREKIEIKKYKRILGRNCYNLAEGGIGGWNLKFASEKRILEFKNRASKASKKNWDDPNSVYNSKEYRKKISDTAKEQRNKTSMTLKSTWNDPNSVYNSKEYRKKLSEASKGREVSKETRDKISKANKGSKNGRAVRFKIDGEIFDTRRDVSKKYGISETAVSKRCKSNNFPNWERLG